MKRYLAEPGSDQIIEIFDRADSIGMAIISRAEVAATFAKTVRTGTLEQKEALALLQVFRTEWQDWIRIQITEQLVTRADALAWEHNLRGYDAVHLAAALIWQETLGTPITIATFDQQLWRAAKRVGLIPFPTEPPAIKTKKP
ncbi:MAG: type II toxin-antitoxin system VapC family toxin [Chloroflexi bacterium]|nr:type II toxin-antitoxin system VapC family toxin [Chloroflexota bacterium]